MACVSSRYSLHSYIPTFLMRLKQVRTPWFALLPICRVLPPTVRVALPTRHLLLTASYLPPPTHRLLLTASYSPPPTCLSAPAAQYRGMGSIDAMKSKGGSADRYFSTESTVRVAQGVSGSVADKGSLSRYLPYLATGLKHSLQDMGYRSLNELWQGLYDGGLRFELRTPGAQTEGGVHDLHSYTRVEYA